MIKTKIIFLLCLILSAAYFTLGNGKTALAQEKTIYLYDEGWDEGEDERYQIGDSGKMEIVYENEWLDEELASAVFTSSEKDVVTVDSKGNYRVVGSGRAVVSVTGYDSEGDEVFESSYTFCVLADLTGANLSQKSITTYIVNGSTNEVTISLQNAPELSYYTFEYQSSNTGMDVSCTFDAEKKNITIYSGKKGTTTITFLINGKTFYINVKTYAVSLKKTSAIVVQKKKLQLKVSGYSGKVKWNSTNKKVVSVLANGTITAKKTGNAVVYATFGGNRVGCAVSVVTAKMKKVLNEAKKIAGGKYSQAKRMQKGFYDCSSLVWRSYKKAGKYFGDKNYAPVAANIAKWCFGKKKRIKGGLSYKNIQNMKLRPGDLLFEGGANNGRYKGIYHVEMMTGYRCLGFDDKNKPVLGILWAARPENYYFGGMMARP